MFSTQQQRTFMGKSITRHLPTSPQTTKCCFIFKRFKFCICPRKQILLNPHSLIQHAYMVTVTTTIFSQKGYWKETAFLHDSLLHRETFQGDSAFSAADSFCSISTNGVFLGIADNYRSLCPKPSKSCYQFNWENTFAIFLFPQSFHSHIQSHTQ